MEGNSCFLNELNILVIFTGWWWYTHTSNPASVIKPNVTYNINPVGYFNAVLYNGLVTCLCTAHFLKFKNFFPICYWSSNHCDLGFKFIVGKKYMPLILLCFYNTKSNNGFAWPWHLEQLKLESRLTFSVTLIVYWPNAFTHIMVRNPRIETTVAFQKNVFHQAGIRGLPLQPANSADAARACRLKDTQATVHTAEQYTIIALFSLSEFSSQHASFRYYEYMDSMKSNECTCTLQLRSFTGAVLKFKIL